MFETFSFEFRNKFCMNKSPVSGLFLNPFFGDYYCLFAMFSILSHILVCWYVFESSITFSDTRQRPLAIKNDDHIFTSTISLRSKAHIMNAFIFTCFIYVNRIKFISFSFYSLPPESPPPT